jgi:hypothetical protein
LRGVLDYVLVTSALLAAIRCEQKQSNVPKLTATFRRKMATFFVVLYALCVVGPHAAMALTHVANLAHCLPQSSAAPHEHASAAAQVHGDTALHEHAAPAAADDKAASDQAALSCCGLFFMSGLAADERELPLHDTQAGSVVSRAPDSLAGHPPGSIHRPPIL